MKKLILSLAVFGMMTTFALAQRGGGYGYNHGGSYGTTTTTYHGHNYNTGTTYSGGTTCNSYRQRVRYEWSTCGTYRWRVVERGYWVPARYVYVRGTRRHVPAHYDWRRHRRTRVTAHAGRGRNGNGYGRGRGRGYGRNYGGR